MSEEDPTHEEEVPTTPAAGGESEGDSEFDELFKEIESKEAGEISKEEFDAMKKGVAKYFSDKGRKTKENAAEAVVPASKETPTHTSDDVTELFLESKPEAALVKDDLQKIADAKYGGSIIKAWKGEEWLHDKASALKESEVSKSKIQSPSGTIETATSMEAIDRMDDEAQAEAIRKMSDKDYKRWKDYQTRKAASSTGGMLSLSPR
jgi:hypothetical protein